MKHERELRSRELRFPWTYYREDCLWRQYLHDSIVTVASVKQDVYVY